MEAVNTSALTERRRQQRNLSRQRLLLPLLPIRLDGPLSASRNSIETYISERFNVSYQAKVTHFLPYLLSTQINGALSAAVGFQPANSITPLFLENYLDDAIEAVIAELMSQPIARNKIVEIGNLTSSRRGSSQTLFILIVAILEQAGFEWVVFTATKHVQQILSKLNLDTLVLCDADPQRLSDHGDSWGSYYNNQPKVLAGNLDSAIDVLRTNDVINFMLENYRNTINDMARQLKIS
ncbi:MAG: thermostable hemolysin [Gammaproteobacteria bacterium]|nr:thermostable hemolysin [Gammaproteobacteria bacterium]MDT8371456.1 thermostable hemolysin [Gammaproteobacteria bacterium]